MTEADNSPSHEIENYTHSLFKILKIHATSTAQITEYFCLRSTSDSTVGETCFRMNHMEKLIKIITLKIIK